MKVIRTEYMSLLNPRDKMIFVLSIVLAVILFFFLMIFHNIVLAISLAILLTVSVFEEIFTTEKITVAVFNNDVPVTKIYEDYEVIRVDYPYYYIRDGCDNE